MANVLSPLISLKKAALDLFFPRWCIGCGREGDYLCESCRQTLSVISPPICPRCGRPQSQGKLCPGCVDWQARIDGIRSPFLFDGLIRRAVHELKYRNLRALASPLAKLMYDYLANIPVPGEVLVPVPLHRKRYRERGYNQSALLSREIGTLAGLPVEENCLVRRSYVLPQARAASVGERRSNVADAFFCRDGRLWGRGVILVDDVSTSGATLDACAGVLKNAGVAEVWGLTLALEL